jgi:hypothetical protein
MNGRWFSVINCKRQTRDLRRTGVCQVGGGQFLSEEKFRNMLAIERKRVERSGKSFLLVLVGPRVPLERRSEKAFFSKILSVLSVSCRQIDIKGWYRQERMIGIIYTEFSQSGESVIREKLLQNLTAAFSRAEIAQWTFSYIEYPREEPGKSCLAISQLCSGSVPIVMVPALSAV